jgi:hypothetical protein
VPSVIKAATGIDHLEYELTDAGHVTFSGRSLLFLSAFLKTREISDHRAGAPFEFDLEPSLLPSLRAILDYLEGNELVLDQGSAEGLLAVARRLVIPRLVQVLYPFAVFWKSFREIIAQMVAGGVPTDADVAIAAKFLCYCDDSGLRAALPDAVVARLCGHPHFRAPSEDAVLDLVIARPRLLPRVVRFQMLSPAAFGRIFDAYPEMPRELLDALAPAFVHPNRTWREEMRGDPRYVDARAVFEDEIFEYSRRKPGVAAGDGGPRED